MFGDGDDGSVICIACGTELSRSAAREYDKEGDRWNREEKTFEYLCKPCDRDRSHQPRRGLEADLVASGAGECDRDEFLARLCGQLEERATEEP
ncbi:DUF7562 family protein [Salinarchaeum laminariae]|uniref:DUF7562 family protein n=1 Tax=Salinarchaeum laminariae TaxID=869888 RepID=UPI0020C0576B|nr:hypothetical protein [Salinarchaeum laminariae]